MSVATQGHDFRGFYYHEDNGFLQSPSDTTPKVWGADAVMDQAEGSNNAQEMFGFNDRKPQEIVEMVFEGSWSVQFNFTNPWWLNAIFGAPTTTDNADGSYTHTWDVQEPQPQRIIIGREDSGKERVLKGCIATQASISPSVNNAAQVTLSGAYASEEVLSPASLTAQPTLSHKPMTFADASLSFGGTTLGYVQQGSMDLQNNMELINEWGTRVAIDFAPYNLGTTFNFSKINEAGETANLEDMYGSGTTVQENVNNRKNIVFSLDNGKSPGGGINKMEATLSGSFPESYAENGLGNPQEDVTEELNRIVKDVSISVTNETQTAV